MLDVGTNRCPRRERWGRARLRFDFAHRGLTSRDQQCRWSRLAGRLALPLAVALISVAGTDPVSAADSTFAETKTDSAPAPSSAAPATAPPATAPALNWITNLDEGLKDAR